MWPITLWCFNVKDYGNHFQIHRTQSTSQLKIRTIWLKIMSESKKENIVWWIYNIGPNLDDRLKETVLKPLKRRKGCPLFSLSWVSSVFTFVCECVCVSPRWLNSTICDLGTYFLKNFFIGVSELALWLSTQISAILESM